MTNKKNRYLDTRYEHKQNVEKMFNEVAGKYDFLNRIISFRSDIALRNRVMKFLKPHKPQKVLDVATGTGDLAITLARLSPQKIVGIDISEKMLELGRKKIDNKKLGDIVSLTTGDAEDLNFNNDSFDVLTVAFGIRNFENIDKSLSEFYRVMQKNGHLVILEFTKPTKRLTIIISKIFYMILPLVGRIFARNSAAYEYLPESIKRFMTDRELSDILEKHNFLNINCTTQSLGLVTILTATK